MIVLAVSTTVFACTLAGVLSAILLMLGYVQTNMSETWKRNVNGIGAAFAALGTCIAAHAVFDSYERAHPVITILAIIALVVIVGGVVITIWRAQVKRDELKGTSQRLRLPRQNTPARRLLVCARAQEWLAKSSRSRTRAKN